MRQNIFSNIFWGLLEYIGLLIPNIVTTWWLTISSFESALVNLYLLTTFGLVAQTLFLSLIVLALIGLLGHYNGTLISIWIYMIILVFLSIIVCFSLSNPSK